MQTITIYPKKLDLLQYVTIIGCCEKIFTVTPMADKYKDLGSLRAYVFDHSNEVKMINDANDYFKETDFLLIYPEKTNFEASIRLSHVIIILSFLDIMKEDEKDCFDAGEKFVYENKVTFCYSMTVGKDELDKVMCKIMTLAIALLTEGLINLDGSGFSSSSLFVTPNEFAKQFCDLTDEEIKKIMS